MDNLTKISQFDYSLPSERIAKFPLESRDQSKLLVYRDGRITDSQFSALTTFLPEGSLLAFNNTKVVRARLIFTKSTGARIEIFCLEPSAPADYERAFAIKESCRWSCIVGNSKKWKDGMVTIPYHGYELTAKRVADSDQIEFRWTSDHTFGELLEALGRIPIPPYLERDSTEVDNDRYQTTYSRIEGSVAAPTAGLHFTTEMLESLGRRAEVTLHVGAGTFLPVKCEKIADHSMHTEHFSVDVTELEKLAAAEGNIIAVGTTTVRTLESLALLGERVLESGSPDQQRIVGQWEAYGKSHQYNAPLAALYRYMIDHEIDTLHCATQIMITPGYHFRTIRALITNFHQPKSTLLLLISAIVGDTWRNIYTHAMENDYRFLSYGDSSILFLN